MTQNFTNFTAFLQNSCLFFTSFTGIVPDYGRNRPGGAAGEKAQTLRFSRSAFNAAAEPKELVVVPNAHHFDLYDKPEFTIPIIEKLTQFFTAALTANSGVQAK